MDDGGQQLEQEKFVRLLAGIQRKLFLFVFTLVPNVSEAEEIVQEVSVVLWRKFPEFRQDGDFLRWACGIARHEVLKHRERSARREIPFSNELIEELAAEAVPLVERADERREALRQCIAELKERHRLLIIARYMDGKTTENIAQSWGKSVEAVRRMLHRIRMALYRCLRRKLRAAELT